VIVASQWWILLGSIDQQMIIYFLGPTAAGYYTNYNSLLMIYWIFLGPLFGFLFPITTELIEKKKIGNFRWC
jgi:O-antigen/teichoic acid export membrane protein